MKKSAIISALFTMMLFLTSFSWPTDIGGGSGGKGTGMGNNLPYDIGGGSGGKGTGMGGDRP